MKALLIVLSVQLSAIIIPREENLMRNSNVTVSIPQFLPSSCLCLPVLHCDQYPWHSTRTRRRDSLSISTQKQLDIMHTHTHTLHTFNVVYS